MGGPLTLAVNGWRLGGAQTGVARYLTNLLRHWAEPQSDFQAIRVYTPAAVPDCPASLEQRVIPSRLWQIPWENLRLGPRVEERVLFCPAYSVPVWTRARRVVVTHDAVIHYHPEMFSSSAPIYDRIYRWSARHSDLVITDSAGALDDIVDAYGVPAERIRVVYLAAEERFHPEADRAAVQAAVARRMGEARSYFLFVGKLSGRRSIAALIRGFAEFKARTALPHKLLVVGLNVHDTNVQALVNETAMQSEFVYVPRIEDDELNLLYNGAEAFVSPSVYETVSLPVMEAQAAATPVICIDSAGMQEITGEGAVRVARMEPQELAAAMESIATNAANRAELSEAALRSSRRFSWKRCAEETLRVLAEAAG